MHGMTGSKPGEAVIEAHCLFQIKCVRQESAKATCFQHVTDGRMARNISDDNPRGAEDDDITSTDQSRLTDVHAPLCSLASLAHGRLEVAPHLNATRHLQATWGRGMDAHFLSRAWGRLRL